MERKDVIFFGERINIFLENDDSSFLHSQRSIKIEVKE